nr:MAG TPA: hypothetical protein [Caudoviricetes sp.]
MLPIPLQGNKFLIGNAKRGGFVLTCFAEMV